MLRVTKSIFQKLNVKTFQKNIITKGNGSAPSPGDTVSVHYTGKLEDGTIFDSSRGKKLVFFKKDPFKFTVGVGQVIKGWDHGILQMQVGERAEIICGPAYAYGARGAAPVIPPNSTLIFDVELLAVE